MPFPYRQGFLRGARESSVGTLSTAALPGVLNGPLAALFASTGPFGTTTPGIGLPTLGRDFSVDASKHISPEQVGRRMADVAMVPGRRETSGGWDCEVTPDVFGWELFQLFGADVVTPDGTATIGVGGVTANATNVTVAALAQAQKSGQRVYIPDGANSEYVTLAANAAAAATSITISGGSGTGGGVKFAHAQGVVMQFGPWSHKFSPVLNGQSVPTAQFEDNWGGAANSLLYPGVIFDSLSLASPFENDQDVLKATWKVMGLGPANPAGVAKSGAFSLPVEEVPIAAGNICQLTFAGPTTPTSATIYAPDLKIDIQNSAKLTKAANNSPDPYGALATAFSVKGSVETFFEDYGVFQDYYNTKIWQGVTFGWTWANQGLTNHSGAVAPSLSLYIQEFGIEKGGKATDKDGIVRLAIDSFTALDHPDYGGANGPVLSMTVINGIAAY